MKNAMKKIMGLLLVAVLLVSAVPFQALAAEDAIDVPVNVYINGEAASPRTYHATGDFVLNEELAMSLLTKPEGRTFVKWTGKTDNEATGQKITFSKIEDDYYLNVYFTEKKETTPPATTEPAKTAKTVPVEIYVDGEYVRKGEITVPVDGKVALTKELGLSLVHSDKTFDKWVGYYNSGDATGQNVVYDKVTDEYFLKLYVTTGTKAPEVSDAITVRIVNTSGKAIANEFQITPVNGESALVKNILSSRWKSDWADSYEFVSAKSSQLGSGLGLKTSIEAGDTLTVTLKAISGNNSSDGSSSNKFPYKVYLHVYLNNNIGEPDRNINITNTLATDGVVSLSEVKNLIPSYYTAKNSDGIGYDGLYLAKGNWVKDYITDSNKMDKLKDVDVRTGEEYVHINVMITNAKAKSSSTADSSNPKTGDAIFMTITVMGLSAAALTGMYFYDKKRKVL